MQSVISRGWLSLRLNFTLKGIVCANVYGPLDTEMVVLQHCCWKFSYKETLDFIRLKLTFIKKNDKTAF